MPHCKKQKGLAADKGCLPGTVDVTFKDVGGRFSLLGYWLLRKKDKECQCIGSYQIRVAANGFRARWCGKVSAVYVLLSESERKIQKQFTTLDRISLRSKWTERLDDWHQAWCKSAMDTRSQ